jgi:cell division protein FtsB
MATRKKKSTRNGGKRRKPSRQVVEARTRGISFLNRFAVLLLVLLAGVAAAVTILPQLKKLRELEADLALTESREREALNLVDQHTRELQAMRSNREFQELRGRDILDRYKPGETVIRIHRD